MSHNFKSLSLEMMKLEEGVVLPPFKLRKYEKLNRVKEGSKFRLIRSSIVNLIHKIIIIKNNYS